MFTWTVHGLICYHFFLKLKFSVVIANYVNVNLIFIFTSNCHELIWCTNAVSCNKPVLVPYVQCRLPKSQNVNTHQRSLASFRCTSKYNVSYCNASSNHPTPCQLLQHESILHFIIPQANSLWSFSECRSPNIYMLTHFNFFIYCYWRAYRNEDGA